jgi:hypothetical protein
MSRLELRVVRSTTASTPGTVSLRPIGEGAGGTIKRQLSEAGFVDGERVVLTSAIDLARARGEEGARRAWIDAVDALPEEGRHAAVRQLLCDLLDVTEQTDLGYLLAATFATFEKDDADE